MSSFDATSVVKPLRWKFDKDTHGIVPEPSQEAVQEFFEALQAAARKAKVIGADDVITSARDAEEALASIGDDIQAAREINDELEDALVKLCGGSPDRETLKTVPYRVRTKFSQWLMKELRPEA
ncbi:hypothetical protein ACIBSV_46730 [Embleya sp. NPDC050154]|uniref:hypothetical protein n=1 Tax=Embleya sp. NPDC050154 TaxID=3363988 RepID=UPI0037897C56